MSRTRSEGEMDYPLVATIDQLLCNGSSAAPQSYLLPIKAGKTKTTVDVVIPRFHQRRTRGEIFNNPFQTVEETASGFAGGELHAVRNGTCSGTNWKEQWHRSNDSTGYTDAFPSSEVWKSRINRAKTLAGTQAWANLADPEVTGMVELAEMRKTLSLLRSPLRNLNSFLDEVRNSRKYRRSRAPSLGKFLSDEWLRYRYGILPLARTVEDIYKSLIESKPSLRFTARGSYPIDEVVTDESGSTTYTWSVSSWDRNFSQSGYVRSGILYEYVFTKVDRYGLSLRELPSTAWELVPFSFVVDWFANVGDTVRALTPKSEARILASWTTVKTTEVMSWEVHSSPRTISGITLTDDRESNATISRVTKTRVPGATRGFAWKTITFSRERDWIHLADSVSLFISRLKYR